MDAEKYAMEITKEFNMWQDAYKTAAGKDLGSTQTCFAAFMCNAITAAISRSTHEPVRRYFYDHADVD